ncbi:NAD(P)-dependent oxidoreductase [Micromonospora cathayae]|uniref:NAD(P)-binding domain-containing protein n=1 Tax=Micromonospora cathayae TaxID=3028804 RepID=A0ABY7ZQP0_9ACTN|nr:NAD(P)-binding domain-containing protein [Micromonospora sp. HUAS 3]WDZ85200.1 NAD(P)-binding domain-containing protein [Micromonospora sp. HUAS 3]
MSEHEPDPRTPVAVLGLGPMGQALAGALLAAGVPTIVWNRSPARAEPLVARGATAAPTVPAAVRQARLLIVCLLDPEAVRSVLARHDNWTGRTLVDLTSGRPDTARHLARWADDQGVDLLAGAILTPTPTIGTPAATILCSGSRSAFDTSLPALTALGGQPTYLGTDPGSAAAYDVALLDLFATTVSGLTHALALASAEGLAPAAFARYASGMGGMLGEMAGRFAEQLDAGHFPGDRSTIASASSGINHVIEVAETHGLDTGVLRAARRVIDRAVTAGHGQDGLARLARCLTPTTGH